MFNSKLTIIRIGLAEKSNHNQSKVDARLSSLGAAPTSAPPAAPPEPALVDYLEHGFKTMVYSDDPGVSRADWFR